MRMQWRVQQNNMDNVRLYLATRNMTSENIENQLSVLSTENFNYIQKIEYIRREGLLTR